MRALALMFCTACFLLSSGQLFARPSAETLLSAQKSVARVVSTGCPISSEAVGSGFLWNDRTTIVTARHVVAGCDAIRVQFVELGIEFNAVPHKELRNRDLVLLRFEGSFDEENETLPLEISASPPRVGETLSIIGFPFGIKETDSAFLDVTLANQSGGTLLSRILSPNTLRAVVKEGVLDTNTSILRLDGHLLPGHSGGPIIGADGKVYGIASGGLRHGAGGQVWATLAKYLAEFSSTDEIESVEETAADGRFFFASPIDAEDVISIQCGVSTFVKAQRNSLEQLYLWHDDKLSIQHIATSLGIGQQDIDDLFYDIWIDRDSGAALAVPAGIDLVVEPSRVGEICRASIEDGLEMIVSSSEIEVDPNRAYPAWRSELSILNGQFQGVLTDEFFNKILQMDTANTYTQPQVRQEDGLHHNRRTFYSSEATELWGVFKNDHAFLSEFAIGNRFIGVLTVRKGFRIDQNRMSLCQSDFSSAGCRFAREGHEKWAQTVLAAQLSTIPPI